MKKYSIVLFLVGCFTFLFSLFWQYFLLFKRIPIIEKELRFIIPHWSMFGFVVGLALIIISIILKNKNL